MINLSDESSSTSSKSPRSLQSITSMIDETLFSAAKVLEAVGLGFALKRGTWQVSTAILRQVLKTVFNLKIEGREHVPESTAAIICTKNSSGAYPLLACAAVTESQQNRTLFQAFDIEFFKIHGVRSLLNMIECIEIMNGEISEPNRELIAKRLADGDLVGLTLENMVRADDNEQIVLNKGMIELAAQAGVPIIPIAIPNAEEIIDVKARKISLNQRLCITIHEPYSAHLDGNDADECLEELKNIIGQ